MPILKTAIDEPKYDRKMKHMNARKNSSMLDLGSTEVQATADILRKDNSFLQALIIVDKCCNKKGKDKASKSKVRSLMRCLEPLRTKLLKSKQGLTNPNSE